MKCLGSGIPNAAKLQSASSTFLDLSLAVFDLDSALVASAKTSTDKSQWTEQTGETDVLRRQKLTKELP